VSSAVTRRRRSIVFCEQTISAFKLTVLVFPQGLSDGGRNKRDAGESRGYLSTIAQTEIRMKLTFTGGNSIAAIYAVTSSPLLWHTDSLYKIQSFHFRGRKFDNSNRYVNTDPDTRRPICSLYAKSADVNSIVDKIVANSFANVIDLFFIKLIRSFSLSLSSFATLDRRTTHPFVTFPRGFLSIADSAIFVNRLSHID